MKKYILLLSLAVAFLFGNYAMAYDFSAVCSTGQTLYYNITSDVEPYTVEITNETGDFPYYNTRPSGNLVIPESVDYNNVTYLVTSIGDLAFYDCSELTSLTIGTSVESIGRSAFAYCNGLTGNLSIPESVTSIGESAFSECSGLTLVTLPNSVTSIGINVFWGCNGLTEPVYNNNSFAYLPNEYTTEYTIPDGIQRIEGGAFVNCTSLTSITIPESVTFIGDGAFMNCSGLSSITIPNYVTSIGSSAFYECSGLTTVNFNAENCTYMPAPWDNSPFTTLNIGENVTNIPDGAFNNCSGLTEVTIPNSVENIGSAFGNCSGLITVNFNATNCVSMNMSFSNCEAFTTLNIGENVTIIPNNAFTYCRQLTMLTIPNSVMNIGDAAFMACSGLENVKIGNSVEYVGGEAFDGCENITEITIYANTPPSGIPHSCFTETTYQTAKLWVPIGTLQAYRNDNQWGQFRDIRELPYWSCDFEGDEMWTFGNDSQGNVQWQIVTPETYPSALISGDNAYIKPFVFQGDTLCDTPWHWAMADLISELDQFGGPGQVEESPWIEFSGIDLTEAGHPQLIFNQIYRPLNSVETLIRVSTDGGATWTDHIVNEDIASNEYAPITINKGVPIFEAAEYDNVIIRFQMNGDGSALQGYGWQIDDIKIMEASAYDLTLKEARISMFGYTDYRDEDLLNQLYPNYSNEEAREYVYQLNDPYAQSPRQQWLTENGFAAFNIEVVNYGYETVTPKVQVTILNPNGDIIYDTIGEALHTSEYAQCDTIDMAHIGDNPNNNPNYPRVFRFDVENPNEIITGRYNVEFQVFSEGNDDADTTDNFTSQYFYITDKTFSLSYDEPTNYYNFYHYTSSTSGDEYGTLFTYYYEPNDITIEAYIDSHTTAGAGVQALIYEFDGNNNTIFNEIYSSDTIIITEDMLDSWITFDFADNFNINFNDTADNYSLLVSIRGIWDGDNETIALGTSDVLSSKLHKSLMKIGQDETWYYGGPQLAIRVKESNKYTVIVNSNNDAYGSVSGGGTYEDGTDVVIMATPNGGYLFDSWEDGYFDNPRTITVTSDSTFIADFVKCEVTQTIDTVVPNFVTVGDHTFYSTGNYSFAVLHETDCDTIFDIRLRVLAEPVYDIGPNPTKSLLNINSDGFISAVEFYSTTGQLVMRKEVNGYEAEFDVEGLMDGVYILRIYGEESSLPSVYRIVKE